MPGHVQTGSAMQAGNGQHAGVTQGLQNSQLFQAGMSTVGNVFGSMPTPRADLNANNDTASQVRGAASDALLSGAAGPWGMAAGAAMKVIDATGGFSDASEGLGGANDALNMAASILLPGAGWFAKKTENYKVSSDMKAMASGYSSTMKANKTAAKNAGAKILFGRNKATSMIHSAKVTDNMVSSMKQDTDDAYNSAATMSQSKAMEAQAAYGGGYNQGLARAAKHGAKLNLARRVAAKAALQDMQDAVKFKQGGEFNFDVFTPTSKEQDDAFFASLFPVEKFQNGGAPRLSFEAWYAQLPAEKNNMENYDLRKAYELAPQEDLDAFVSNPNAHLRTAYKDPKDGIYYWMKSPNHPTAYMEEEWYNEGKQYNDDGTVTQLRPGFRGFDEWQNFKSNYKLVKPKDGSNWMYIPITNLRASMAESQSPFHFKEGGQMNVIPEGNLHARLHHMEDSDNITKKGIPVVDKDGNQQAEIELNEIIFNLEVTKKLEELYKKYGYTNSKRENDDLAIEAGKLLAKEIMENTDDRTGLINQI